MLQRLNFIHLSINEGSNLIDEEDGYFMFVWSSQEGKHSLYFQVKVMNSSIIFILLLLGPTVQFAFVYFSNVL